MKYFLASLTLLTVCTIGSSQTVTISERLPDGEYIVLIDGQPQRTLTSAHADDIKRRLGRLSILEEALPVCRQLNEDYKERIKTAKEQDGGWEDLFRAEHQVRIDTQAFVKRPSRFTSWMDKPIPKLLITFVPPIINAVR